MNEMQIPEASSRRNLLRGATLAAVGIAAADLLIPTVANAAIPSSIPGTGDIQVLNYALALEDLAANLYTQALLRLTTGGTDPQAATKVGNIIGLGLSGNQIDVAYIAKFILVEAAHRDFFKAALGDSAITTVKPAKYDFGIQSMSREEVLDLVLKAEATGVQAYLGVLPCLTPKSPYSQTVAAIQGTEARHTTIITIVRNILSFHGPTSDPTSSTAPLRSDPGGTVTETSYDNARPNWGTPEGRDLVITPDQVLARVGGFIKYD